MFSLASWLSTARGMPCGLSTGGKLRLEVLKKCCRCCGVIRVDIFPPQAIAATPSVCCPRRTPRAAVPPKTHLLRVSGGQHHSCHALHDSPSDVAAYPPLSHDLQRRIRFSFLASHASDCAELNIVLHLPACSSTSCRS